LGPLVLSGRRPLTQTVVFEKDVLGDDVPLTIVDVGFGVRQGYLWQALEELQRCSSEWDRFRCLSRLGGTKEEARGSCLGR
jgi:hypothetical protein